MLAIKTDDDILINKVPEDDRLPRCVMHQKWAITPSILCIKGGDDMFFYKIEANLVEADETKRRQEDQAVVFQTKAEKAFLASGKNCYIFISGMRRDKLICGVIARTPDNMERAMPVFMKQLGFQTKTTKVSEITMKSLISLANRADRNNYIEDSDELLAHFDLDDIDCGHRSLFSEYILDEPKSLAQLKKLAKGLPGEQGLIEELDRVFAFPKPPVKGHPVHYIVRAEDKPARMKTMDILLSALFSSGRIASRRCCTIDWPSRWSDIGSQLELLYASSIDGVVAFDCKEDTLGDEEDRQILLNCMRKHKNRVLTVLCLSDDDYPVMQKLRGFSMLELREDRLCKDNAKRYLRRMAQAQGTMATKELYQSIGNEGSGYRPSELDRMFDVWFEQRLKTEWFPQYADIGAARCGMERKDAGSAYAQLQNMIGLSEAKAVIDQALDFFKL